MKKSILFLMLLAALFSCKKTNDKKNNLELNTVVPDGCAIGIHPDKQNLDFQSDTVVVNINEDSLSIWVGYNAECGPNYDTKATFSNDTIYLFLERQWGPYQNCLCYYVYDFHFTGLAQPCYYVVDIDGWKFFSGNIEP